MRVATIASSSSGNCIFVESAGTKVLVDAGLSGKRIEQGLLQCNVDPRELDAILVTHEHIDHTKGVGIMSRKYDLPIYANELTWEAMETALGKIQEHNKQICVTNSCLEIGELQLELFATSHDAADPIGLAVYGKDEAGQDLKLGIATDTGVPTTGLSKHLDDANALIFEANHDENMLKAGSYPWSLKQRILSNKGHLSNEAAAMTIARLIGNNTSKVVLAHLSKENNVPDLAKLTVEMVLKEAGIDLERDVLVEVAPREQVKQVLW